LLVSCLQQGEQVPGPQHSFAPVRLLSLAGTTLPFFGGTGVVRPAGSGFFTSPLAIADGVDDAIAEGAPDAGAVATGFALGGGVISAAVSVTVGMADAVAVGCVSVGCVEPHPVAPASKPNINVP